MGFLLPVIVFVIAALFWAARAVYRKGHYFSAGVLLLVLLIPAGVVLTLLLFPLWSWIENTWNIESVGHSGPADWCYIATYLLLVLIGIPVFLRSWRTKILS